MKDRAAIDTIKGYFYQFDYAISELLNKPNGTDAIVVEGIEDVDISTATEDTAVQCKYYAKTEYNHSVIAKPIRLMLDHYKEVIDGKKSQINYKLYGFFQSGQNKLTLPIDSTFLKDNFLTYTKDSVKYYHHTKLNLTDAQLDSFLSLVTINIAALEYQAQLNQIFNLLIAEFTCNAFEAEHFYYNNALKVIKEIAVEGDITKRQISKSDFIKKIDSKKVLFNEWFVKFKGEANLFSSLRKQYFTYLNISPFERFFIVDVPATGYVRADLKELVFTISNKWSKLSLREPNPFCPYVYFNNISRQELIELKGELHTEQFSFVDGFDFDGSAFSETSISRSAANGIPKIKILSTLAQLESTIATITKTKEIYQFYLGLTFFEKDYPSIKQVKIQFSKLSDIKKII